MAYLDNNATTRPTPEVVAAVAESLELAWANPSSVHKLGQAGRRAVELARASLARLIGAKPRDLVLCSSGTESIDLAIRGALGASGKRVIVTDRVEHAAVRDLAAALEREQHAEIRWAPVDAQGVVDANALGAMLDDSVGVVSVQWANNETGVIQPVGAIADACRGAGAAFHCDAVQWAGKMPVDMRAPDAPAIDLMTFSPHKFHGPKGVGCLWVRPGASIRPAVHGSQELGRRGGTENVPGIVGAGVAAEQALAWVNDAAARAALASRRDAFEARMLELVPDAQVHAHDAERLWNTTNIGFPGLAAESMLMALSERGVEASAGAACSSGSLDPSPVLLAMGVPERVAHGSVRFSLSRDTGEGELEDAARAVAACAQRLRAGAPPEPAT